jgi:hypothetical protein
MIFFECYLTMLGILTVLSQHGLNPDTECDSV